MQQLRKIDRLLAALKERVYRPLEVDIPLHFTRARSEQRQQIVAGDRQGWVAVNPEMIWGEPQSYFWFAGEAVVPPEADGQRLFLYIDAQFGNTMGRSDPQCLVRIDGRIAQGADGNHRELLLSPNARAGSRYDILIEAGTIESRRQIGFACKLLIENDRALALYYDLRVPLDVARLLPETDYRRQFILKQILDALAQVDLRPGNDERFAASLARAGAIASRIYEARDTEAKPVVTVTGHTHIDVAWLWRIRETRQKMGRSMATALALMDEFDDYRFMYNQGVLLDYLSQDYPELFERIRDKTKSGQFEIEGALWLEPDANMTSGESFVRHILKGVRYHRATFGVQPRIVWLPDTFGYSAALPQIMSLAGLDTFVTHKLSWNDTNRLPNETFHWQGIDGTRVATYFLTAQPFGSTSIGTTYNPDIKPTHVMGAWRRYAQKQDNQEIFLVYGHGDGGGGPTREMLENIRRMERGIPGCPEVRHEHMRPFFDRLLKRMHDEPNRFPVWVGELYLEFHRGTFTSVAKNKRNNRFAETMMRQIEALACSAFVHGAAAYPKARIDRLWECVLLNQFHDILPGSSIGEVFDDSDADYASFFADAKNLLAELAGPAADPDHYIVFNALGRPRSGLIEIEQDEPVTLSIGQQSIQSQPGQRADGQRIQIAPLTGLAASAANAVRIDKGTGPAASRSGLVVAPRRLENDLVSIDFDPSGRISSILDKKTGRQVLIPGQSANRLQAFRDMPAEYDAWDIDAGYDDQFWEVDDLVSSEIVEHGPYRAAIRFEWRYEKSRIVQVVSLEADKAKVEFDTLVDWHEHQTMLKTAFPADINAEATTAEIQFGHVRRPTHRNTSWDMARFECPMLRWLDISEPDFGIALLNDCKYGYDALGTTVRLTLLRSPTYPWPEADQGEHRFKYALVVHQGTFDGQGVPAMAEEFNLPLSLLPGGTAMLSAGGLVELEGSGLTIESIKKAEDDDGIVVRLWECHGRRQTAQLRIANRFIQAATCDLLEENRSQIPLVDGLISLSFKPFEIRTLYLQMGASQ